MDDVWHDNVDRMANARGSDPKHFLRREGLCHERRRQRIAVRDLHNIDDRLVERTRTVRQGAIPWIGAGGASTPTTISFSFSAPYTGGIVADYVIQYRITGQGGWKTYGTVTWIGWQTIAGLSKSTSYDVRVYATNHAGNGPASATFTTATTAD